MGLLSVDYVAWALESGQFAHFQLAIPHSSIHPMGLNFKFKHPFIVFPVL
jgi:hypothetical protein